MAIVDQFIDAELAVDAPRLAGGAGAVLAAQVDEPGGTGRATGVTNWATFIGSGGPRFYLSHNPESSSPNYALSIVNATSRAVISDELIPRLEAFCLQQFPDLEVTLNPLQLGPPVTAPVQVRVSGRDEDALFDIVDGVKAQLRAIPGTKNVTDDWGCAARSWSST